MMDRLIFGNTSVKSAFDIALHDRSAQHADLPLWKFLGAERCFDLVTDHTVSLGDPGEESGGRGDGRSRWLHCDQGEARGYT